MRVHYILDEGLAVPCQTGVGLDSVESLQKAIKYLVKTKEVCACEAQDLEVYAPGTTKQTYKNCTPLKPTDKLPSGTTSSNAIFVHAPQPDQELTPEERRLYANPRGSSDPTPDTAPTTKKAPPKPKTVMARPEASQLKIKPESKQVEPKPKNGEVKPPPQQIDTPRPKTPSPPPKLHEKEQQQPMVDDSKKRIEDIRKKKEKAKKKKKKDDDSDSDDVEGWPRNRIHYDYTPEPMDMSTFRCWYQLGDTVPYYIRINGWEKVGVLKQRIVETRGSRTCSYLEGVEDASVLRIFPPGTNTETGKELEAGDTIPTNSTMDDPLIVIK